MAQKIHQRGFTLIELIVVIMIMGLIGGVMVGFMIAPIDAYFASSRRAALTDTADTVVRHMARDIRKALPNSIHRSLDNLCVEFIPTKTGGRYRTIDIVAGDSLDFAGDTTFNMLGDNNDSNTAVPLDQLINVGDVVAVNNNLVTTDNDAYKGGNTSPVVAPKPARTGSAPNYETVINISVKKFPSVSNGNRFHVVPAAEQVVGYVCTSTGTGLDANGTGNGNLIRYVTTLPRSVDQQSSCAKAIASPTSQSILATKVSYCSFAGTAGKALVSMVLQLTDRGETVSLQHQVHVNNAP